MPPIAESPKDSDPTDGPTGISDSDLTHPVPSAIAVHIDTVADTGTARLPDPAPPCTSNADGDSYMSIGHDAHDCFLDLHAGSDLQKRKFVFTRQVMCKEITFTSTRKVGPTTVSRARLPRPFPTANILKPVGQCQAPTRNEDVELPREGSLHLDDDGIVRFIRKPTPAS